MEPSRATRQAETHRQPEPPSPPLLRDFPVALLLSHLECCFGRGLFPTPDTHVVAPFSFCAGLVNFGCALASVDCAPAALLFEFVILCTLQQASTAISMQPCTHTQEFHCLGLNSEGTIELESLETGWTLSESVPLHMLLPAASTIHAITKVVTAKTPSKCLALAFGPGIDDRTRRSHTTPADPFAHLHLGLAGLV